MLNLLRISGRLRFCAALLAGSTAGFAQASIAASFRFANVTFNSPANVNTGRDQLMIDVGNDIGGSGFGPIHQVRFTFHNIGTMASAITDIYFDEGTGGTIDSLAFIENIDESVYFQTGATPSNLPGASEASPPFHANPAFSIEAPPPETENGMNPGETVRIVFNLLPGKTIPDVVTDMVAGNLRVGLNVQGFANGGAESFVNLPTPVPEPLSLLPGLLFGGLAMYRSRRSRSL